MTSSPRLLAVALLATLPLGCQATSTESASADTLTANVGIYAPPPAGLARPRVGVPDFEIESGITQQTSKVAADQLTTLAVQTQRFAVIERAQIEQLLKEQGLVGVVNASQIAASGQISGVDYLLIGKVTNMRVKQEQSGGGFNIGRIVAQTIGAFDYENRSSTIKVDCGVDIRLVDATTGLIAAAQNSEFSRTDSISSFGISILGVGTDADADLRIDDDNRGKILRLALDDAVRKMLPSVDNFLLNKQ